MKLSSCIPNEFKSKPRNPNELKRMKATEFRQFLFYTGPLVIMLTKTGTLVLHVALTILSHPQYSIKIEYAFELLIYFVKTFEILYGAEQK